jgi:hypothetical protein
MSYKFVERFRAAESGWNGSSLLILVLGFIKRKFVTMHGHMNVKYSNIPSFLTEFEKSSH